MAPTSRADEWPGIPQLGPLVYIRFARTDAATPLPVGCGPARTLESAVACKHPYASELPLDPLLHRALRIAKLAPQDIQKTRAHKLAKWAALAEEAALEKDAWLRSLPSHVASVFRNTGFNGPLFQRLHQYLVSHGYPDTELFDDICRGMPIGGVLPASGLWPARDPAARSPSQVPSVKSVYQAAPDNVRRWARERRPDPRSGDLIKRSELEVSKGRRVEVPMHSFRAGSYVAHPEFLSKGRAIDDCTESGWNGAIWAQEKLQLPRCEDIVDYATRLLKQNPSAEPRLAVADEAEAFRNWPNRHPSAMVMLVMEAKGTFRAWRDLALCFGDASAVYAYNRIRTCLTIFFRSEFGMAVWSYYDDSPIVEPASNANFAWYVFIKMHSMLCIPLKGNPLGQAAAPQPDRKYLPPARTNKFLGLNVSVASLPCSVASTEARVANCHFLIDGILAAGRLSSAEAASTLGKLRFLGSALHGKCGIPALQPIAARQHERSGRLTSALRSSLQWLRQLVTAVGPMEWSWGCAPGQTFSIFGDASEPSDGSVPRLGGVLLRPRATTLFFEVDVPAAIIGALPRREKLIYYYELLWPAVAAYAWREVLSESYVMYYEDSEGAKFNLLGGFSSDFAASVLLAFFWGAAAAHRSRPWISRVASADNPADCLTKASLPRDHLRGAICTSTDFGPFWVLLQSCLRDSTFPAWSALAELYAAKVQ